MMMGASGVEIFEREAARYDLWFDTARGGALFESEVRCLREIALDFERPWLEVGVGTGRFAEALAVDVGVDPARTALAYAARRGIRVASALGQELPFENGTFRAVFVVVTICFADDPLGLLREARRVAGRDGAVVLGIVPASSPWGRFYAEQAEAGHAFYSRARFFDLDEIEGLARHAGLELCHCNSTLFQGPGEDPLEVEQPRFGRHDEAGFVAAVCRARDLPARVSNARAP
jgi:ubiquinone/menaquinone biosynthesis C-methylase UbiE